MARLNDFLFVSGITGALRVAHLLRDDPDGLGGIEQGRLNCFH